MGGLWIPFLSALLGEDPRNVTQQARGCWL